ncbi:MAG: methyl-accepting chemotaxis protein [Desulfamplus sp.]|nr:methyl-accepting chemotaxis protein [Desulfamplus sp.]
MIVKMQYIKGLRGKLLISICGILLVSLTVLISFITINAFDTSKYDAIELIDAKSTYFASRIENEISSALYIARSLSYSFTGLKMQQDVPDRLMLIGMMRQILEASPQFLGIWTVWEPNALDGKDADYVGKEGHDATGRFIAYWNRVGGLHLEPCMDYEDSNTTGYYAKTRDSGKEIVLEPATYEIGGKPVTVVSACVPIKVQGKVVGVTGVDFSMDKMGEMVKQIKVYDSGYGFLATETGVIVAHPSPDMVGKSVKEYLSPKTFDLITNGKEAMESFVDAKTKILSQFVFTPVALGESGFSWSIGVNAPIDEVIADAIKQRNITISIAIITVITLFVAIYFIVGIVIINPVKKVVGSLNDIASGEGDTTKRIKITSQDEIGELSSSFNLFMDKLQRLIILISENSKTIDGSSKDLVGLAKVLSSSSLDTSEKSTGVASATEEMKISINAVSEAMEQALSNINIVATATEEMSATIREISKNSENARAISDIAVTKAKKATDSMSELGRAAQEIGKVTETINEISEQTNLLALNATIEAARAGEAGKGFSVVASEIKALATQTVDATNEIKRRISEVQTSTVESVNNIKGVEDVIRDVNSLVLTIASAIEEQSIATSEIADNIGNASHGLGEVGENMNQINSASVNIADDIAHVNLSTADISSNSTKVNENAVNLAKLAEKLNQIVSTFKI